MIVLKSSGDANWPWSNAGDNAEKVFAKTYPSLYKHCKRISRCCNQRQDQGKFWWERVPVLFGTYLHCRRYGFNKSNTIMLFL